MRRSASPRLGPLVYLALGTIALRTRKVRAVLSSLGISLGIAMVVAVVGIPQSSRAALLDHLQELGPDLLTVTAHSPQANQAAEFPATAAPMVGRIGPVTRVAATADTHALVQKSHRSDDAQTSGISALATSGDLDGSLRLRASQGRLLSAADQGLPVTVIGATAARRLGIARLHPGDDAPLVVVDGQAFTVVGILAPVPLAPELDTAALLGWSVAERVLGFDGRPSGLYVTSIESQIDAVRAVLPATVSPEQPALASVTRPSVVLDAQKQAQESFSGLLLGLAGVGLLVGGIGVANTMIIAVLERRGEIGLRRSLGATGRQILGQFLAESLVLSALGGLVGATIGVLATAEYALSRGWPVVLPLGALGLALAGAVAVGALAGLYPALRAARLSPTEALAA